MASAGSRASLVSFASTLRVVRICKIVRKSRPMPELPDVTVYCERLAAKTVGTALRALRFASPFVLRSVEPRADELVGRGVLDVRRLGKRIVIALEGERFIVVHLMIAGRLKWGDAGTNIPGKIGVAAFDFANGAAILTEASTQKRASIHLVRGVDGLAAFDRGGLEVLDATSVQLAGVLRRERHTLKRTLTDPTLLSGIGNAYSDEILHHAGMSPVTMSDRLSDADAVRLLASMKHVLTLWTDRLRGDALVRSDGWPDRVTAFRPEMAVHGKFGEPCPRCDAKVQRIVHGAHETDYCATCQTGGKLLADRSLSRLLKGDWPKTVEELEERKRS